MGKKQRTATGGGSFNKEIIVMVEKPKLGVGSVSLNPSGLTSHDYQRDFKEFLSLFPHLWNGSDFYLKRLRAFAEIKSSAWGLHTE